MESVHILSLVLVTVPCAYTLYLRWGGRLKPFSVWWKNNGPCVLLQFLSTAVPSAL